MMKRKLSLLASVSFSMMFLAGCAAAGTRVALTPETASGFWERIFVLPLIQFIEWLYNFLGHNLGFAIILATLIVRVVLMPLFAASQKSAASMQLVQPEIERLKKKYEGKKDPESQQKMQMETMELYKKHKINPMAGCLPLLLQMPIFMAFFQAINRHPLIVDMEQGANFFGMDLSATMSVPNYVLGVLVALLTFLSQRLMTPKQTPGSQSNKTANTTMKVMNYYMPFMMFSMVIGMPAAMGLYFLTGNIVQMVQSLVFKRPAAGPTI
ncbi:MAG: YidC/Oxa1 family membrane protein insertase [Turicibacter sp.]|nr:YidC/Oxa1 family membrane protein insertase [Turicibacter sp.]